jgi:hypothetical protein
MRKSKGYAKGGAKMMKARRGKMAKGYAKGGAKMMKAMRGQMADRPMNSGTMSRGTRARPMGAMKGRMASKGYAKGGAKMMKASKGKIATMTLAQAKKVLKKNNMKAVKIKS